MAVDAALNVDAAVGAAVDAEVSVGVAIDAGAAVDGAVDDDFVDNADATADVADGTAVDADAVFDTAVDTVVDADTVVNTVADSGPNVDPAVAADDEVATGPIVVTCAVGGTFDVVCSGTDMEKKTCRKCSDLRCVLRSTHAPAYVCFQLVGDGQSDRQMDYERMDGHAPP